MPFLTHCTIQSFKHFQFLQKLFEVQVLEDFKKTRGDIRESNATQINFTFPFQFHILYHLVNLISPFEGVAVPLPGVELWATIKSGFSYLGIGKDDKVHLKVYVFLLLSYHQETLLLILTKL